MSAPTVIKHKQLRDGFAVVVTNYDNTLQARFQIYSVTGRGGVVLQESQLYSTEAGAIAAFEEELT